MIPVQTAWIGALVVILSVWLVLWRRSGPMVALGVAVILSYLLPGWVEMEFAGFLFDVRLTVAIVALIGLPFHADSRVWTPLTLPDLVISAIVILHATSDIVTEGFSVTIPLRAYGEWVLPYVAGRYAVRNHEELRQLAPWAMGVLAILSVAAIAEILTGVNIWEVIFARANDDFVPKLGRRWGFTRATGTAINPIFFAMVMFLLLPWPSVMFANPDSRGGRWKAAMTAVLAVLGVCATLSRGPVAGLILAAGICGMIRMPRLRWVGAGLLGGVVACAVIWPKEMVDLTRTGLRDQSPNQKTVQLEGEELEYSGTLTRLLLFRAYSRSLRHAGFLGYGTEAVRVFPPNVPHLPKKSEAILLMRHVDNAYVLMGLRFGWLGIATFALLLLSSIWTATILSRTYELKGFCSWLASVLTGTSFVLLTVYLASDFGFVLLWTCGLIAGLASQVVLTRRSHLAERVSNEA